MDDDQRQIVLGTLLGNGFICNNNYLCIQHSCNYYSYLTSKVSHLSDLARPNPWYHKNNICGWRSKSLPIWKEFRDFCYNKDKKSVTMEWLDQLRAIGIAIWYGDSGCLVGYKNRNACLRTQSLNNEIINQYFNEVGIPCNVNKSRNSSVIVFTIEGSRILFKMVAPFIHHTMYDKLLNIYYEK
jgi:hypothetical protein